MGCSELCVFPQRKDHRCPLKQAVIKYSAALIHFLSAHSATQTSVGGYLVKMGRYVFKCVRLSLSHSLAGSPPLTLMPLLLSSLISPISKRPFFLRTGSSIK